MTEILVILVILIAGLIQSISGFGLGLVAMPLLTEVIGLKTASPLVALISIIINITLIVLYQSSFQFQAVYRLIIASVLTIPLGFLAVNTFNEKLILSFLQIVIMSYVVWNLLELQLPILKSPKWAYGFGILAGFLSGAYNTGGPPVVIYGNCCQWTPEEFKSNLNGFFLVNTIFLIFSHFLSKNYTVEVCKLFLLALPSLMVGLGLGTYFSQYINPSLFRRLVLILLLLLSIKLIYQFNF